MTFCYLLVLLLTFINYSIIVIKMSLNQPLIEQLPHNTYLGIKLKPGYSFKNLAASPLLIILGYIASNLYSIELPFLLMDESFFGVSKNNIGMTLGKLQLLMMIPTFLSDFMSCLMMDVYGRRFITSFSFIGLGLAFWTLILSQNQSYFFFLLGLSIFCLCIDIPFSSPIISDIV